MHLPDRTLRTLVFLTLLNLLFSFVLIGLGGFVHNTGSSLACPDWPLCFGQVFPKMEGQVAIEHSHRLLASLVGFISMISFFWLFRLSKQNSSNEAFGSSGVFKWAAISFGLVVFQGILGGITVILKISPLVSTFHLATSQIYFASLIFLYLSIRRLFPSTQENPLHIPRPASRLKALLWSFLALLFLQIVWGAAIRHTGASAACGFGPRYSFLCENFSDGSLLWWPEIPEQLASMIHRYLGVIIGVFSIFLARSLSSAGLRKEAFLLVATVLAQIAVGVSVLWTSIAVWPVTFHLSLATLIWAVGIWSLGLALAQKRVTISHSKKEQMTSKNRPLGVKDRKSFNPT